MRTRGRAFYGLCAGVLVCLAAIPEAGAQSGARARAASRAAPSKPPSSKTSAGKPSSSSKGSGSLAPRKPATSAMATATQPVTAPPPSATATRVAPPPTTKPATADGVATTSTKEPAAKPDTRPAESKATTKPAATTKRPGSRPSTSRDRPASRVAGSEIGKPDERARRAVTGRRAEASDADPRESAELIRIRELDHLLFPPGAGGTEGPWPGDVGPRPDAPLVEASGLPPRPAGAPAPMAANPADVAWVASLEKPDFPVRLDAAVVRYLTYYRDNPRGRSMLAGWVKRSGRYGAAIRKVLRERHLPEDLLWLALVESGFDPTIHSHAGAAGLWQFVPSTARVYGLSVTRRVDERLDPERATHAAARHLEDLFTRFGSWELAFAAYNMGYGGVLSAIRKYNTNDYWELRRLEAGLPYETALYVPKIASIAIATRNCKVFGCEGVELDDPEPFGDGTVDALSVAPGVSLLEVADAIGVRAEILDALNPHVLGTRLPPIEAGATARHAWTVYVPKGKARLARNLVPKEAPPRHLGTYRVRWGEPTEHVAARFGTSSGVLERLNDLDPGESVRAGTTLFVPAGVKPRSDAEAAADVAGGHGLGRSGKPLVVTPTQTYFYPDRRRMFYQPVLGDTLDDVAEACGVAAGDLRRWNHLDARAALQEGMTLQVFLPASARTHDVLLVNAAQLEPIQVASSTFHSHFVGQLGRERLEVTTLAGDTWTSLANRHGMSVGMLERINHRSRKSKLAPGEKVVVYARKAAPPAHAPTPRPTAPPDDDPYADDADEPTAPSTAREASEPDDHDS